MDTQFHKLKSKIESEACDSDFNSAVNPIKHLWHSLYGRTEKSKSYHILDSCEGNKCSNNARTLMDIINGGDHGCNYTEYILRSDKDLGVWANSPSYAMKQGGIFL